ncbi:hypothetical protein SAMN05421720_1014 [Rhodospira trueperi]|uniref:Uncharacterized protein n=2 Tax=Rhodospira trueperi TaxID=69960 RepID=A0A1G6W2P1_9PROT|nr:hypothetical protein SAMN05421720_1014 [Rhodospira trueperi]
MADAPASIVPMTVIEAHLYAYLGCILGLFKGQAVGDWGYRFAVTSEGFPFSVQFETARSIVVARGLVDQDGEGMMTARRNELAAEIDSLLTLGSWGDRRLWLRAATQCALALPVGSIRHAISQTPGLAASVRLGQRRHLLQANDIDLLYQEYRIVSSVLGSDVKDLLSPAVIWLSARILRTEDEPVD